MSHPIHKHMSGQRYDATKAYDKDLTASARLHYLENSEHDKGVSRISAVDPPEAVMAGKKDTRDRKSSPAEMNVGGLHRYLGIPEDEKIPMHLKEKAARSSNERVRKMGQFAVNMAK